MKETKEEKSQGIFTSSIKDKVNLDETNKSPINKDPNTNFIKNGYGPKKVKHSKKKDTKDTS